MIENVDDMTIRICFVCMLWLHATAIRCDCNRLFIVPCYTQTILQYLIYSYVIVIAVYRYYQCSRDKI